MTASELVEEAGKHCTAKRYEDGMRTARAATVLEPQNANAWWQLSRNAFYGGKTGEAITALRETIHHAPGFPEGWYLYGQALLKAKAQEDAEKAFQQCLSRNPNHQGALISLAELYRTAGRHDDALELLLPIYEQGQASANVLNLIGIAYHNKKQFGAATDYYRRYAAANPEDNTGWFNLGLVYNHPEVSQDVDAVDAWRIALSIDPAYAKATELLEKLAPRLTELAKRATAGGIDLLPPEDRFVHYINPFELLVIEPDADAKTIQRAKNELRHEIELEDGKITWLQGHVVTPSAVEGICRDLDDPQLRAHHAVVFRNKPLLRFLSRGEVTHFLYHHEKSPFEVIEELGCNPKFAAWLSKTFARQFDLIFGRSLDSKNLPVIEAMLDGRRWVLPQDEDICFAKAHRFLGVLIAPLQQLAATSKSELPRLEDVQRVVKQDDLASILNLLPIHFREVQSQAVAHLRSIAIDCNNEHGNAALAMSVLKLTSEFVFKDPTLNELLKKDRETLEKMLAEEAKHSFSYPLRAEQHLKITKDGVRLGGAFIPTAELEGVTWGVYVHRVNGIKTQHDFTLIIRGRSGTINASWGMRGVVGLAKALVREKGTTVPIAEMSSDHQEAFFQKLIDAVIRFVAPAVLSKLIERVRSGQVFNIGECTISQGGVSYKTGLIFRSEHRLPWSEVGTHKGGGSIHVFSRTTRKGQISMEIRNVENAVLLPLLVSTMTES